MDIVPAYAAVVAAGFAAALDVRSRRIPNWLTGGALLAGLLLNLWLTGGSGVVAAVAGSALGLCLLLPFYALGVMGAGDVKLLAGLGALVGPQMLVSVAVYGGIAGGLVSLAFLLSRGHFRHLVSEVLVMRRPPAPTGIRAPYGIAIAVGMVAALLLPAVLG